MTDSPPRHIPWVERMLRTLDHIHAHLDADVNPAELARLAGFSPHHFHRVFRGMVGESVMGYVRRLRLERAALRLKHGESSVSAVAIDAGYGSHEAFTRAFRDRFGVVPSAFRDTDIASEPPVRLQREPARQLLAARHIGAYEGVGAAWETLIGVAGRLGWLATPPITMGLVYDDPDITDAAQCRYEAAIVVPDGQPAVVPEWAPPTMIVRTLPAGTWACLVHVGGYDSIQSTYDALLGQALPRRGIELADEPTVEVTLDDPRTTPPDRLRTDIRVRLT
jgi:AraC family transcriptional regulator